MKRAALLTTALLAGAGNAQAQSSGFYTDGFVEYGYLTGDGDEISMGYADFSLGFGFGGGSSLPMGFDLGVLGGVIDGFGPSDSEFVLFPTVWLDTSVGRFSIGTPRSAIGSAFDLPNLGGSNILKVELNAFVNITDYVPLLSGVNSYGARFDGNFGGFDTGLSVHGFTGVGSDSTSITGFVGRDYGAIDWVIGVESFSFSGISRQSYFAQVGYDVDQCGGSLTLIDGDMTPNLLVVLGGFYKPLDWLTLNATYINFGSSNDTIGVSAEASFLKNGYAGIGYLDSIGGGGSGITTAYVGWKLNY